MTKTIIWFSGSFCAPCKTMEPAMEAIAEETPYDKVMIDQREDGLELARQWQVSSVPTLVLVDGGTEIGRSVGAKSEKDLRDWIDSCSLEAWTAEHGNKPLFEVG